MDLDYSTIEQSMLNIRQSLADSDMGSVETHLLTLQTMLQGTPHLVDMLLPEDIGTLVTVERKRMQEDILAQSMPKKRVSKAKPKRVNVQLELKDLATTDLGNF